MRALRLLAVLAAVAIAAAVPPATSAAADVELDGTLLVVHADARSPGDDAVLRYFLRAAGDRHELRFRARPDLAPGQRVRVHGTRRDGVVVVERARALGAAPAGPAAAAGGSEAEEATVSGTDDVLVLLTTTTAPDGVTPAEAQALVGTHDGAWYRETSYGAYGLRATVPAWLEVPDQPDGCALYDYLAAAKAAARSRGIEPDTYERVMVYLGPGFRGCEYAAGFGEVGGRHSWIVRGYMDRRVTIHELGHNIGLWHSHALRCHDGDGAEVPLSSTCEPFQEYGDLFDAMGHGFYGQGHFNAHQKDLLGWMAGRTATVALPLSAPKTVTVTPMSSATGVKGVRIGDRPFWAEFRRPTGNDAFLSGYAGATDGVLVHVPEPSNGSHLLDMKPTGDGWFGDAALASGAAFTDPAGHFTVKVGSVSASSAAVTVLPHVPAGWGYVLAERPTATSYTPNTALQANAAGALNTVNRTGRGAYTVGMRWIGARGGVAHVTAHGAGTERCQPSAWYARQGDQRIEVRCFTAAGAPVDTRFLASWTAPDSTAVRFAHLFADEPGAASYTPRRDHQFSSTGRDGTVTRTSTGTYEVRLPGLGASAGTVVITARDTAPRTCQVAAWRPSGPDQTVLVRCFDPAGARTDTPFALTYAHGVGMLGVPGRAAAYVLAGRPSTASYTPPAAYSLNTTGATNTVTRSATGTYTVRLPGVGRAGRGHLQVTPYASDGSRCKVASFGRSGYDQLVKVVCTTPSGAAADTRFVLNWTA